MFDKLEKRIIIMSLMYFLNDYTEDDFDSLNAGTLLPWQVEEVIEKLIGDFVGPTWDEETTAENIKQETEKRKRT